MNKEKSYFKNILFVLIILFYIYLMAKILLFKSVAIGEVFDSNREIIRNCNFIPFHSIKEYYYSGYFSHIIATIQVVGNIIIFIPFGFLCLLLSKDKKFFSCIWITLVFSLFIEMTQGVLGLGVVDIDDVILNFAGGFIGGVLYKLLLFILKGDEKIKTFIIILTIILIIVYLLLLFYFHFMGYKIKLI
ncbi:MAG: VanZ family protein [Lachnospirales bacterium]